MTRSDSAVVAGTPATTTPARPSIPGRVDTSADGDEPLGEAPELTMPRVASLVDRQADALNAIREYAQWLVDTPGCGDEPSPARGEAMACHHAGKHLFCILQERDL